MHFIYFIFHIITVLYFFFIYGENCAKEVESDGRGIGVKECATEDGINEPWKMNERRKRKSGTTRNAFYLLIYFNIFIYYFNSLD